MITTALDTYKYFLDGINKERTTTVTPDEFNRLINMCEVEWIRNKYSEFEYIEKRIDDLRILEVRDVIPNTGTLVSGEEIFILPYNAVTNVSTSGNPTGQNHGYMYMLNVAWKIQYVDNECCKTGESKWIPSRTMKANFEWEIQDDPYNKPKDDRLYHKIIANQVELYTGTNSYGIEVRFDYLRYPRVINVPTSANPVDIVSELPLHTREEVISIAIRKELGRIESPRYQQQMIENAQTIT